MGNELSKKPQMTVYGMIRKDERAQTIKELGGHPILADLEGNVDKSVDNMEAIIFAAGSGPKTGPDKTTAVDKNGAIKLVAAKKKGIERFVMLSSVGSDHPEQAQAGMRHYLEAKHDADEHLKASGLTGRLLWQMNKRSEKSLRMRKWIILISPFQGPMSPPFLPNLSQRKKHSIKHSRFSAANKHEKGALIKVPLFQCIGVT
ncbi:NAD(P)H-binding protein [Peribacillus frigoritolerans]|nr:NAD(P)H-binding protein [Peribacillus frigoritolerans]